MNVKYRGKCTCWWTPCTVICVDNIASGNRVFVCVWLHNSSVVSDFLKCLFTVCLLFIIIPTVIITFTARFGIISVCGVTVTVSMHKKKKNIVYRKLIHKHLKPFFTLLSITIIIIVSFIKVHIIGITMLYLISLLLSYYNHHYYYFTAIIIISHY